jgi:hypothetical protein
MSNPHTPQPMSLADMHDLLELLKWFHEYALEYAPSIPPRSFVGNSKTMQSYVQDAIRHRAARAGKDSQPRKRSNHDKSQDNPQ